MAMKGTVLEIQRMSTEDGPGLRTSVFLKGCSLACRWCHNPESISFTREIQWRHTHCIGCRICVDHDSTGALEFKDGMLMIDRGKKTDYSEVVKACPSGALEMIGEIRTSHSLVAEVLKDRAYFTETADGDTGGITISGGEPVMQKEFVADVLKALQDEGIHTTLDTCGMYPSKSLETLLPNCNLILFDVKLIDPEKHREYTGSTNTYILENLKYISNYIRSHPETGLWIRTPIIPGTTDTIENIEGIAQFLNDNSVEYERWELCAFNNLCNDKYERLGMEWDYKASPLMTEDEMDRLVETAKKTSHYPERILWTGSVRNRHKDITKDDKKGSRPVDYCKITAIPT